MTASAEPHHWSIRQASEALRSGSISAVELTEAILARIAAVEERTRAYVCVLGEQAISAAREIDDMRNERSSTPGALAGIPIALKDIYDLAGVATTASSLVRKDAIAESDSAAVERLRAAGAIFIGKTVTDEFAYGTVCPPTRNPWDLSRIPGGSSGGSGAALAAGECLGALGSDTAGSIRTPAALNGIVGIKPTFGRISKRGLIPLAWSVDHPGPMARRVEDVALLLGVIAGHDPYDPTTVDEPVPDYLATLADGVADLTLGVARNFYFDDCEPAVAEAVQSAATVLSDAGARIVEVSIPWIEYAFAAGRIIVRSEAASYHEALINDPASAYGENTRLAIEAGKFVPAAYYLKAQRARTLIKRGFETALQSCDVILAPTIPITASPAAPFEHAMLGSSPFDVINGHVRSAYPANLAGVPALSVPCGFSSDGLPIGLQIIGRPFDEATVLRVGHTYENATNWHRASAPL